MKGVGLSEVEKFGATRRVYDISGWDYLFGCVTRLRNQCGGLLCASIDKVGHM